MALKGLAKLLDEAVNAVFTTGKHFENLSKPMRDELAKIFKQSDNLKDDVADWVKKNDASLPDNVKSYLGSNTFESTIGRLKGIKSFGDDFTSLLKSADYDIAGKSQDLLKRLEGWLPRGQYDDMAAQMGRQASRRTKAIDDIMNQSSFRAANSGLTQAQLQAKATTEYLTRMDTLAARTGAAIRATPGAVASGVGTAARVTGQALWSKPGIIITSF
ncbi:MAG: hypothetical protein GC137_05625, partial [Alphaproteobacteria bacterium]|nr:hypothetical protein [Alphaproteobacteria bacterium]